jgi:prevent-host-death family protein
MQTIGMFEAKTHLTKIVRNVQKGEKYILKNRDQEVAVIMSVEDYNKNFGSLPYEKLRNILKDNNFQSIDDIIDMRDEGRIR